MSYLKTLTQIHKDFLLFFFLEFHIRFFLHLELLSNFNCIFVRQCRGLTSFFWIWIFIFSKSIYLKVLFPYSLKFYLRMERFLSGVSVLFLLILFQSYTSTTLSFCSMILSFEITKGSPNFILLSQICWGFFGVSYIFILYQLKSTESCLWCLCTLGSVGVLWDVVSLLEATLRSLSSLILILHSL